MSKKKPTNPEPAPALPDHIRPTEVVDINTLKPHPRNYRQHPDDEVEHLVQSLLEHGFYKNIVVAQDDVILAGHGMVIAAKRLNKTQAPIIRLPIASDSPLALKILVGDNEISHLAMPDDRMLTEILRDLKTLDPANLKGTGYDEAMIANLLMVTRPASEIASPAEAAEWVGMPEFDTPETCKVTFLFDTKEERAEFLRARFKVPEDIIAASGNVCSLRWPPREKQDVKSIRFEPESPGGAGQ